MNSFLQAVESWNDRINAFVWGPVMLAFFLLVGVLYTLWSRCFQLTRVGLWVKFTILAIFRNRGVHRSRDKKSISQFQALSTSLAATIGTGSVVGVATAITAGGPGAVFWMWVSALLGMMTSFAENALGIRYRYKNEKGEWMGGAMVYMERGLGQKKLAVLFALLCMLASFGIGNMTQANAISASMQNSFQVSPMTTGIVLSLLVGAVVIGGIQRIAGVAERIVPFMSLFFVVGGLIVIAGNYKGVPEAFRLIFQSAFRPMAAVGGAVGYTVSRAIRFGVARGVFSNEAGLGSSVIVHAAADVKEPVIQGMWGIFEVFVDTILVCSITALCILSSGVWRPGGKLNGVALSAASFSTIFGSMGGLFVSLSIILFAFATLIGWSYYGEKCSEYLFGIRSVTIYRVLFVGAVLVGCLSDLDLVWNISDTFNGLMAIPNLIALTLLSPEVITMTKDFLKRYRCGKISV